VKFTNKGEIILQVQKLHLTEYELKLKWEMIDTGIGISEKNNNNIFKAFQQEDNTISRRYGGTGLGLYITKEIITKMNGHIYVESKQGEGTRFVITTVHRLIHREPDIEEVPLLRRKKVSVDIGIDPKHHRKQVLVAEDNEVNQMLIGEMLDIMKLEMTIARNGLEAVAFTRKHQYDLIMMDIHMPIMDGVEATDKIREMDDYDDVPIIGLTADVIKEHMDEYKKHGFTTILTKPVYLEELIRAINKYL
jgi:CheY-like chemotaxis protein